MTFSDMVHPARARLASRLDPDVTTHPMRDVCAQYRRAIRCAGLVCPAEALREPGGAVWMRRHGVPVDVCSSDELALLISAGIAPARIVMHGDDRAAGPLRCAVNAGVGRFVLSSAQQVAVLAHWARRPQRILVDVTARPVDGMLDAVFASERLEMIGLYCRVTEDGRISDAVVGMIEQMARIRRERGRLVARLGLAMTAGPCPRRTDEEIEDALDHACARYRFPRPAVALSLRWPSLDLE